MTLDTFAGLELSRPLLRALEDADYNTPTPIQAKAIPLLLDGHDLFGIAQTGTGKTAAFVLPLLQNLEEDDLPARPRCASALILVPTRELALQISESIKTYGRHLRLRHAVVMGGVGKGPQAEALRKGVDILVATPGRLLDLLGERRVDLHETEYLIIDEADRMLDMGFIRDVRRIVSGLPKERQTLLFSATMPAEISRLAREILFEPERVEIAARSITVESVDQRVHHLDTASKRRRLTELLGAPDFKRVIVFTRTKHGANRVVRHLGNDGISAEALHGNKSQNARLRALENFRAGRSRVLVATDIAARGIDIDGVTHVINYELPEVPECYVHRIGRTARAGAAGIAISFCDPSERSQLRLIERLIKRPLTVEESGLSANAVLQARSAERGSAQRNRNRRRSHGRRPRAA